MVKACLIRVLSLTVCLALIPGVSACGFDPDEPVTKVQYYTEDKPLMNHIVGLDGYESLEYEAVVHTTKVSIGPSEPEYRGIIILSDDIADEIWNKYEWKEAEPGPFEFEKIDTCGFDSVTWYYSEGFEKDTIKHDRVNYIYFSENTVIFSFQTF